MNILKMLFGTKNERDLKRIAPIVEQIKKIEEGYEARHLTAEDYPKMTAELSLSSRTPAAVS